MARPSRPSVRFTALEVAEIITYAQSTNNTGPSTSAVSWRNETALDAGVRPLLSGNWSTRIAKATATTAWPISFALARRPSERCL